MQPLTRQLIVAHGSPVPFPDDGQLDVGGDRTVQNQRCVRVDYQVFRRLRPSDFGFGQNVDADRGVGFAGLVSQHANKKSGVRQVDLEDLKRSIWKVRNYLKANRDTTEEVCGDVKRFNSTKTLIV